MHCVHMPIFMQGTFSSFNKVIEFKEPGVGTCDLDNLQLFQIFNFVRNCFGNDDSSAQFTETYLC